VHGPEREERQECQMWEMTAKYGIILFDIAPFVVWGEGAGE